MGVDIKSIGKVFLLAVLCGFLLLDPASILLAQDEPDSTLVTLKPGDVVRVNIWRQSDLSGEYVVDEDGFLMLPLIGEVDAGNQSTVDLRHDLVTQYDYYLKEPFITVTPLFRVNVMGEVASPGLYNVDATVSLADLLAMAGGLTNVGSENKIMMVRNSMVIQEDLSLALERGEPIEEIGIRSGDKIVVGKKRFNFVNMTVIAALLSATAVILSVTLP